MASLQYVDDLKSIHVLFNTKCMAWIVINRLNNDICADFSVQASRCVLVKKLPYFKKSELEITNNRCLIHKFLAILNYLGLCPQIWLCSHLPVRITSVTSFKFQKSELPKTPYTLSKYYLDIKVWKRIFSQCL